MKAALPKHSRIKPPYISMVLKSIEKGTKLCGVTLQSHTHNSTVSRRSGYLVSRSAVHNSISRLKTIYGSPTSATEPLPVVTLDSFIAEPWFSAGTPPTNKGSLCNKWTALRPTYGRILVINSGIVCHKLSIATVAPANHCRRCVYSVFIFPSAEVVRRLVPQRPIKLFEVVRSRWGHVEPGLQHRGQSNKTHRQKNGQPSAKPFRRRFADNFTALFLAQALT